MSGDRLEEIRARVDAATAGPWTADRDLADYDAGLHNVWEGIEGGYRAVAHDIFAFADAEFIAHAREDIPCLLSRLEAAEERLQAYEEPGWTTAVQKVQTLKAALEAAEADARQLETALEEIEADLDHARRFVESPAVNRAHATAEAALAAYAALGRA